MHNNCKLSKQLLSLLSSIWSICIQLRPSREIAFSLSVQQFGQLHLKPSLSASFLRTALLPTPDIPVSSNVLMASPDRLVYRRFLSGCYLSISGSSPRTAGHPRRSASPVLQMVLVLAPGHLRRMALHQRAVDILVRVPSSVLIRLIIIYLLFISNNASTDKGVSLPNCATSNPSFEMTSRGRDIVFEASHLLSFSMTACTVPNPLSK